MQPDGLVTGAGSEDGDRAAMLDAAKEGVPLVTGRRDLNAEKIERLRAFLQAQTSPSAVDLSALVPDSVPSGLPVRD